MILRLSYKQTMAKLKVRENGIFYAVWEEDRKTRRMSLHTKDKQKAKIKFNHFIRELMAGKVSSISEGTITRLYDYVKEFLEHIESTCTHATYVQYDVALRKAKSSWGDMPLNHISTKHVDTLVSDMFRDGLRVPTVNKVLRHVKSAMAKAYQWEYIKSPVRFPKMRKEEKTLRFLSADQLRSIVSKITDPEYADYCLFAAYTGLRSGEIIRLQWADIDNPEGFIRVSPKQKNKHESRIPINSSARSIIDRCKSRNGKKVFRLDSLTWASQQFKAAARNAGIPDARFHDLRHTFASHLAMAGEDLKSIQDLMRHESIASTMVYAKVSPEHLRKASEAVNYGPMPIGLTTKNLAKNRP